MSQTIIDQFIAGTLSRVAGSLPDSVLHQARRCLLDYLGATFAGARMATEKNSELLRNLGGTEESASLIGMDQKAALATASLINGISSHTAELDDGVMSGIIHPGAPLFSALLPTAQIHGCSGEDLLCGIIAGYEGGVRIANAIQPSHKLRGYHATATCGALGAVVGISVMKRTGAHLMKQALSAAAVCASGSLKVLEDDSRLKAVNAGQAAASAVVAVALAESGFTGPEDAFAGKAGFLAMMADECDFDALLAKSQEHFAIEGVYFKPYAACRYCHPAIEAALKLREKPGFDAGTIRRVRVSTYRLAVTHHDHTTVESVSSAKMSIPFSTAVALVRGSAGIGQYTDETIRFGAIDRLAKLVEVEADEEYSAAFPQLTSARVELTLEDGRNLAAEVHEPKGDPGNPLSDAELEEKFLSLARFAAIPQSRAAKMAQLVWNLPADNGLLYGLL